MSTVRGRRAGNAHLGLLAVSTAGGTGLHTGSDIPIAEGLADYMVIPVYTLDEGDKTNMSKESCC